MALIDKACWERGCACYDDRIDKDGVEVVKREWVGLTDEEVEGITRGSVTLLKAVLSVEAKLKEKNA